MPWVLFLYNYCSKQNIYNHLATSKDIYTLYKFILLYFEMHILVGRYFVLTYLGFIYIHTLLCITKMTFNYSLI